jgi:hypothetical protein
VVLLGVEVETVDAVEALGVEVEASVLVVSFSPDG